MAMGVYANSSGAKSVALGYKSVASGATSAALGYQATASGDDSAAFGNGAKAVGTNSVALGSGSIAQKTIPSPWVTAPLSGRSPTLLKATSIPPVPMPLQVRKFIL